MDVNRDQRLTRRELLDAEKLLQTWDRDGDDRISQEEVPHQGDPYHAARRRKIQGFFSHTCAFVTVGGLMWWAVGQFPFWMMFWGIGLSFHFFGTLPHLLRRRRSRRLEGGVTSLSTTRTLRQNTRDIVLALDGRVVEDERESRQQGAERSWGRGIRDILLAMGGKTVDTARTPPPPKPVLPARSEASKSLVSDELREEIERLKGLLERRHGDGSANLTDEVDQIVRRIEDIAQKRNDLEEQTSDGGGQL